MRDPWIRRYFGPEVNPRPGFGDELADDLMAEWRAAGRPGGSPAGVETEVLGHVGHEPGQGPGHEPGQGHGHGPTRGHEPVPLRRRPTERTQPARGSRRWTQIALAAAAVLAVVGVVVWRQQADDTTVPGNSPGVTLPGSSTVAPGTDTTPGQTGSTAVVDPAASTTVDQGENTAQGTQYMSPACHETRPTTAIPAAIPEEVLATGAIDVGDASFIIQLPSPQAGAVFNIEDIDVRVVPGGVLVKASVSLPDGTASDTLLSVVNNDGVVRWTRCFTNAYTVGPFGENGDGSATIWVARNTTDLARYVDLATGETSDLLPGYTGTVGTDGLTGIDWALSVDIVFVYLPADAGIGIHEVTLP